MAVTSSIIHTRLDGMISLGQRAFALRLLAYRLAGGQRWTMSACLAIPPTFCTASIPAGHLVTSSYVMSS